MLELNDLIKDKLIIIVTDYEHTYEVLDHLLTPAEDIDFCDQLPHTLVPAIRGSGYSSTYRKYTPSRQPYVRTWTFCGYSAL
jgi:hypothetical protein